MLRRVFIFEGANDEMYRETARKCVVAITQHLKKNSKPIYTGQTDEGGFACAFKLNKIKADNETRQHLKNAILFIESTPVKQSKASFQKGAEGQDIITIYIEDRPDNEEDWEASVLSNASEFVADASGPLFHEIIHMLDIHRHKDASYSSRGQYDSDKVRSGDRDELVKYYNSPMEYNAYVQEDLNKIAEMVKGSKTWMEARTKINTYNERDFIDKFLRSVGRYMRLYLTPEVKRHVIKRASQFWQDLERKYSG